MFNHPFECGWIDFVYPCSLERDAQENGPLGVAAQTRFIGRDFSGGRAGLSDSIVKGYGFQVDKDNAKDSNIGSVTTLKKLPNNTIDATLGGSTLNLSANK